jgi:hypothetical protein
VESDPQKRAALRQRAHDIVAPLDAAAKLTPRNHDDLADAAK